MGNGGSSDQTAGDMHSKLCSGCRLRRTIRTKAIRALSTVNNSCLPSELKLRHTQTNRLTKRLSAPRAATVMGSQHATCHAAAHEPAIVGEQPVQPAQSKPRTYSHLPPGSSSTSVSTKVMPKMYSSTQCTKGSACGMAEAEHDEAIAQTF